VPKAINDFQTVESVLPVAADLNVCDLNVSLNITHTYRADLQVSLISPSGKTVFLHNRTGGSADNLIWTYDQGTLNPDGPGSLDDFGSMSTLGTWRLRISDVAGGDFGTLNSWSLSVTTAGTPNYPTNLALSRESINYHDQGSIRLTLVGGTVSSVEWFEGTAPERFIARTTGRTIRVPSPAYPTTYTAKVTSPCSVNAKTLTVNLHVVNPDVNNDGFIDFEDFDTFVGLLEAGDPNADFNRDGFLTFEDFDEFVSTFIDGGCFLPNCPCDQTVAGPYTNPYGDPYGDPYCPWCPYGGEPGLGGEYGCPSYRLTDAARGGVACPVNSEYLMGKADQRMAMAAGLMSLVALGFTSVSRRRP
jgi:subtilisin-like proprotein convertase family protein